MSHKTIPKRLMILAAGMSSRMRKEDASLADPSLVHQANNLPKCMIGLGKNGQPFLDYLLHNAAKGGVEEVLLVLTPADAFTQQYYTQQLAKNQAFPLKLLFARQYIPEGRTKPLGTSDAILQALSQHPAWQEGRFIVCNSDNIYPIKVFEKLYQTTRNAMIAFDASAYSTERVRNCAIVQTDAHGFLNDLIEKPTDEEWAHITATMPYIGISWNIFALNAPEVMPFLEDTPLHPIRQERELPVSIRRMAQTLPQSIKAIPMPDLVPDLTSKADIADIQQFLDQNFMF
jgi:glucose-1-phosphate adenylyltransferase